MDSSLEAVSSQFPNDAGECHDRRTGGPKKSKKKTCIHTACETYEHTCTPADSVQVQYTKTNYQVWHPLVTGFLQIPGKN